MDATVYTTSRLATAHCDGLAPGQMALQHGTAQSKRGLAQRATMELVVRPVEFQLGLEQRRRLEWWMGLVLSHNAKQGYGNTAQRGQRIRPRL